MTWFRLEPRPPRWKEATNRLRYSTAKEGLEHNAKMKENAQMEDQDQGGMNNRLGKTTMGRK
jgi:hypothetical protein